MEAKGVDFGRLQQAIGIVYRSNAAYLDSLFGDAIEQVSKYGLSEESLVVFTADHGETLSRDNAVFHWTHGFQLSPEDIVVPLIVRSPGIAPGRYEQVTRSIDLLPTLASLAGIRVPESARAKFEGRDLSSAILQQAPRPSLTAYFHSSCNSWDAKSLARRPVVATLFPDGDIAHIWTGLIEGDTLVRHRKLPDGAWIHEVYDLASDPGLERNLFASGDPRHAAWVEALGRYRDRLNAKFNRRSLGEEELEALRSLGYVD
jgi:arylsulfatase A-like enzyme